MYLPVKIINQWTKAAYRWWSIFAPFAVHLMEIALDFMV